MSSEFTFVSTGPAAVEVDEGLVFLVDDDGNILERLIASDQCMICYDVGPWVDEETGLCEMCTDNYGDQRDPED